MKQISRRHLLRGAGGIGLSLPLLEAMGSRQASAQAAAPPKRVIFFLTNNGSIRKNWLPSGTEQNFVLSRILQPLAPHQADLVVLDGMEAKCEGPGNGHPSGAYCLLTGRPLLPVDGAQAGTGNGISVDQYIASKLKGTARFPTLDLGVVPHHPIIDSVNFASFVSANQPVVPDGDPANVFRRFFSDTGIVDAGTGTDNTTSELWTQRKSVLDVVLGEYRSLAPRLSGEDKLRLESHLDGLRRLEQQIIASSMPSAIAASCHAPAPPPTLDPKNNDNFAKIGSLQLSLLTNALACDLTRVGVVLWGGRGSGVRMKWLGIEADHHELSHMGDKADEDRTKIETWYAQQFSDLISQLKATPDGGKTLFDSTLLVWANDLGDGGAHGHLDVPYVLAGSAGGAFKTGRYLRYTPRQPSNNMLVSVMNAMGLPDTSFGQGSWCTGPLPGLA